MQNQRPCRRALVFQSLENTIRLQIQSARVSSPTEMFAVLKWVQGRFLIKSLLTVKCDRDPSCGPFSARSFTYSEDVISSSRHHLLWRHHSGPWVNDKLLILVAVDDAVSYVAVRSQIAVIGEDTVDGFTAFVSVSFGQADTVGDLREGRRIVVRILHVNYYPHGGLACGHWTIYDCDLMITQKPKRAITLSSVRFFPGMQYHKYGLYIWQLGHMGLSSQEMY